MFIAIAANENFHIHSVDIKAAFLQSKELDRNVFVEPPKDIAKENLLWKLKKNTVWFGGRQKKILDESKEHFI